ncbi:MAG: hypothetical protein IPM40_14830 [Gammaproteobacteria bacterium]|nr:hypothetical protein [Gammaproteobacteria bacterium]
MAGAVPEPRAAQLMPRAAQSLLIDIARAGERLVAVGERGHVLYSDDSGQRWIQAPVPVSVMLTAVWFLDAQHGWAVGHDGMIIATDDGGASWRLQRDGLAEQQARDRAALEQARRDLAAREGSDTDAAALEEARAALGEAEERASQPAYAPPLMDVWFADADNGIAVGAYGSYLRTSDGGRSWIHDTARIDNPDELHYYAIVSGGSGRLLIVGESGSMFRSRDGGASWEALSHAYEGTLFGALAFTPGDAVCAFGLQGTVLVSPDFGDTWRRLDSPTESVLAGGTIARDGEALIVGNVGTMLAARLATGALEDRSRVALRDNLAGVIEAPDGSLVVIGQGGAVRVPAAQAGNGAVVAGEAGAAPAGGG